MTRRKQRGIQREILIDTPDASSYTAIGKKKIESKIKGGYKR